MSVVRPTTELCAEHMRLTNALRKPTPMFDESGTAACIIPGMSNTTQKAIREAFFFEDQGDLRGSRLRDILRGFGQILSSSVGSEETYDLSATVSHIDWFISHNWSVGRWEKTLALVLFFHTTKALVATFAMCCLAFGLTAAGILPTFEVANGQQGISVLLVGMPTFCICLCAGYHADRCLDGRSPTVFLDKTCIHQTDMALKKRGIAKLGAFMRKSSGMVVVYSDVYLRKLWTAYEVACFLVVNPDGPIVLVPLFLPKTFVCGLLLIFASNCALYFAHFAGWLQRYQQASVATTLIVLFQMSCIAPLLRHWAREQEHIRSLVQAFSIKDTVCFDENDRPVVYGNIAMFMEAAGLVAQGARQHEALEKFDELVQEHMPRALQLSLGSVGLKYRYGLVYFLLLSSYCMDMMVGTLTYSKFVPFSLWLVGAVMAVGPLGLALLSLCLKFCTHLPWLLDWCFTIVANLAIISLAYSSYHIFFWTAVAERAVNSQMFLLIETLCVLALVVLTVCIYRPWASNSRLVSLSVNSQHWADDADAAKELETETHKKPNDSCDGSTEPPLAHAVARELSCIEESAAKHKADVLMDLASEESAAAPELSASWGSEDPQYDSHTVLLTSDERLDVGEADENELEVPSPTVAAVQKEVLDTQWFCMGLWCGGFQKAAGHLPWDEHDLEDHSMGCYP
mmetsp:Transcript_63838/g.148726  ORF Transcript_63838/g.148726 Transcript_63838/m.148726 type:complete len:684 (-) Transcript_63838:97-2148(-)